MQKNNKESNESKTHTQNSQKPINIAADSQENSQKPKFQIKPTTAKSNEPQKSDDSSGFFRGFFKSDKKQQEATDSKSNQSGGFFREFFKSDKKQQEPSDSKSKSFKGFFQSEKTNKTQTPKNKNAPDEKPGFFQRYIQSEQVDPKKKSKDSQDTKRNYGGAFFYDFFVPDKPFRHGTEPRGKVPSSRRSFLDPNVPKKKRSLFEIIIGDWDDDDNHEIEVLVEEEIIFEEMNDHLRNIFAGSVASAASRLCSHPLDVLKARYQGQIKTEMSQPLKIKELLKTYRSIAHDVRVLYIERGIRGFYKGHSTAQFVGLFQTITLFWTYEQIRPMLDENSYMADHNLFANFAAGFCSGTAVVLAVHPLELLKQRISVQNKLLGQISLSRTTHELIRLYGWRSFYRGALSQVQHMGPLYGLKFLFYNIFCDEIMEHTDFEERESIPTLRLLTAGAATGIISNFLIYPSDLIRIRMQSNSLTRQRYKFSSTCRRTFQCYWTVVQREGFLGLYKGLVPCLLRSTISTAVQFTMFDKMHKLMVIGTSDGGEVRKKNVPMDKFHLDETHGLDPGPHYHLKNIFAGSASSSMSRFLGQPFDILKIRFQLQEMPRHLSRLRTGLTFDEQSRSNTSTSVNYRSIPHAVQVIYREEGIRGFWRGHNMSQTQGLFQGMAQFWTFEQIRPQLDETVMGHQPSLCNFLSGFITGCIVVMTLSPLDIMRTTLMAGSSTGQSNSTIKVATQILSTGGVRSFYRGGYTAVLHVGSAIGCKFMFYNIYCDIYKNMVYRAHVQSRDETTHDDSQEVSRGTMPAAMLLMAGAAAGVSSNLVTYPMELIKRRLQIHAVNKKRSAFGAKCTAIGQCLQLIWHKEGFLGLYKGILPCVIKSAVSTALQFSAFDKLRKWSDNYI